MTEPRQTIARLASSVRRLDQVGIAALAAGVLVLIGIGFAVFVPLLAGPPKAEALPASTSGAGTVPPPLSSASGSASPSAGPSLLTSAPPGSKVTAKPSDLENQLVSVINKARSQAGCQALKNDGHLRNSAGSHSDDMAKKSYLSRTGSDGSNFADRIRKAGYRDPLAEDIGRGYVTAQQTLDAWMAASDMRSPIVSCDAKAVGVGVTIARDGTAYWTADFGR